MAANKQIKENLLGQAAQEVFYSLLFDGFD